VSGFFQVRLFANFTIQVFLQLTHSPSFIHIRTHINEPGDAEWLERLKVKWRDVPH